MDILGLTSGSLAQVVRFGLGKLFQRQVRFGSTVERVKSRSAPTGSPSRLYWVRLTAYNDHPTPLEVRAISDGSGDGMVFFPYRYVADSFVALAKEVDLRRPHSGRMSVGISADPKSNGSAEFYFAPPAKDKEYAYALVEYIVLDERQSKKTATIRFSLAH